MLDYKFIKDNLEAVKENIKNRNMTADPDLVVTLFDKRTALVTEKQNLQQKRNENAAAMKGKLDAETRTKLIAEGKAIKEEISKVDSELEEYEKYTQTQKYVEDVAKEKLGLVYEDEIVFKEE